jgi:hypothetical protein
MSIKGKLKKINEEALPLYEIFINDDDDTGMNLISVVEKPAIEIKGYAFSDVVELEFKQQEDKQIIVGPALIPNKKIRRQDEDGNMYYVFFSKETIEKMVEKFNRYGSNRKINVEHTDRMIDAFIMEDWIVEDQYYDKSKKYGFEVPVGTYMIKVKVEDKNFWMEEVKGNGKFGFSIEGLLGQQLVTMNEVIEKVECTCGWTWKLIDGGNEPYICHKCGKDNAKVKEENFQSYTDYPKAASENAKVALRWAEENGWGDCGTPVGKARANQLANGEAISEETISRMASFARHLQWEDKPLGDGCGKLMLYAWGGREGIEWASRKLEQIREEKMNLIDELDIEDLRDIHNFLEQEFSIIRSKKLKSSNVKSYRYNTETYELEITFNDGSKYKYFEIDYDTFENISYGDATCITTGENEFGSWYEGKSPSIGAAIWEYLINNDVQYEQI